MWSAMFSPGTFEIHIIFSTKFPNNFIIMSIKQPNSSFDVAWHEITFIFWNPVQS